MDLDRLIGIVGYPVVLIGVFVEGETILVLSGFAVHRGYLTFGWVIAAAFCGAFMGDQLFFYLGRFRSGPYLERHPSWRVRIGFIQRHIDRFRTLFVLGYRFVWGIRTASPFVLGMGGIHASRFALFDAVSVLVWATTWVSLGYLFGDTMRIVISDIEHYELEAAGIIVVAGLVVWSVRLYLRVRRRAM
jgi:membrane protein DedA with SNARE-associated domain